MAHEAPEVVRRPVRSYVLRQGRLSPAQARALELLAPRYVLPFAATPLDFARVYGRVAPVVLEIGCGMGETTAAIAQANPGTDFLGVEVHAPGVGALLNRIGALGLVNLRVIRHDAVEVVQAMIAAGSLAGVHVYFPDPWPKKRHHKRRLIQTPFIDAAIRCTKPAGRWLIQTDHAEYFAWIRERLDPRAELIERPFEDPTFGPGEDWAGTNFEVKYEQEGRAIHRVAYERRA